MIRNFVTTALRNILRHKGYSALNIFGLAVGLASAFIIVIWMRDEFSMDRFHEDADRIYSVMRHSTFGGTKGTTDSMPKPMAQAMLDEFPEVENTVLLSWPMFSLLRHEDESVRISGRWAGSDFFEVFTFPMVVGDPTTALEAPESITLSENLAERFFGSGWRNRNDLIGSQVSLDNRIDLTVTGVFETPPANSTLQFDFVVPMEEFIRRNDWVEAWDNNGLRLWARLHDGVDVSEFNQKISGFIDEHHDSYESEAFLYPISDKYLYSNWENGVLIGGRIDYIRIFGLVGLVIILIASINFMNLATARSAQRSREIGVRKTIGASRGSLAWQFMGESVIKAGIAFIFSLALVAILIPGFNSLTQKSITITSLDPILWVQFLGIALVTGILAGSYPAMYLSSFSVTGVFAKRSAASGKGSGIRKVLVVLQFAMSIILIVGTVTVYRQLEFIRSKDLGLNRENVAMVRLEGGIEEQFDSFKYQLLEVEGVNGVTRADNNPLQIGNDTMGVDWEGKDPDNNTLFWNSAVGYDFVSTMGIAMSDGRPFSRDFGSDSSNYLINWQAAEKMGMTSPVGQQITFWDRPGTIIGVMEDFHMGSMYQPIRPVILRLRPDNTWMTFIRIEAAKTAEALAGLESLYKTFNPEYPLNVRFMDDEFEESYRNEAVIGAFANIFAVVAIFIACLGLFGLASFTAERRTREIGIRKVMGASVPHVVTLMSREFLLLVGLAFLIAAPISWKMMNDWLSGFAYHTEFGIGILAVAGLVTLTIALLTVSYQSILSALANPVNSLRSD